MSKRGLVVVVQGFQAQVDRAAAQLFLNAEQLVVLCNAVGAADGARLDLSYAGRNGEVGDEGVLGFAGAVRDDRGVAVTAAQVDSLKGFGNSADLVDLDENRIAYAFLNATLQALYIGDENVIAHQLDAAAELIRKNPPAVPVIFGQAVFEGHDRVLADPVVVEVDHLFARKFALIALLEDVLVLFLVVEL